MFYLKELKIKGHGKIDMLDISNSLKLPAAQIEKIMEELKSGEFVKEIN